MPGRRFIVVVRLDLASTDRRKGYGPETVHVSNA